MLHSIASFFRVLLHLSHRTAGGVEIIGNVSKEVEQAIDAGIAESIAIAHKCYGWTRGLSLRDYTVHIETGEDHEGLTVYRVPVGSYKGTPFDQGGFMFVTGTANAPQNTLYLAVIEGRASDVQLSARYEIEHCLAYANDKTLYRATAIHGTGQGHPILTCNQPGGLAV